jgi:hypothetical protein
LKKPNREKKPIKPIKILKNLTGSVSIYKLEIEKTELKPNKKKTRKN